MDARTQGQARQLNDTQLDFDAVIVGAGFAGLYMLHRLRKVGLTARLFEMGDGVGGTWYWNRYPGARCDVPSFEYSYEFDPELQQEWEWSERYAAQPQILAYLNHVTDRYDLRRDIQFNTRVLSAHYQDDQAAWLVKTDQGDSVMTRFLVMATGCLSARTFPDVEGLSSFAGETCHTGDWPRDGLDVAGKRVGVIGTGSSGIQVIPELARQAQKLVVFQRTPAYSVPSRNRPLEPGEQERIKANYDELRAEARRNRSGLCYVLGEDKALEVDPKTRQEIYEERWKLGGLGFTGAFKDLFDEREANQTAAGFVRDKIRQIVKDEETARKLMPETLIGCKRLCVDNGYYETFNRENVELVDLREKPLRRITPDGVVVGDEELPLDVLVFATGFDAMTGALLRVDICGRGGQSLKEKWGDGPKTYLGLTVAGFPNMFTITGPGSPSVLSNMVASIEQHVEWIGECLGYLQSQNKVEIDAEPEAEDAWVAHVNEVANRTIYPDAESWYVGSNVPGKPRVFMPYIGVPDYVRKCQEVAQEGYSGFRLR